MAYRADMPEYERKARNRAKTAAYRVRQKERMAVDPHYAAGVQAKQAEGSKRQYENTDPEVRNAYNREWHRKEVVENPEYVERKNATARKSYSIHREKRLQEQKEWREKNDRSEYNLQWSRANRDKRNDTARRRKALEKGATEIETFTKAEIWESFDGLCGICLEPADPGDWHLDHIIPLSRGGQHVYDNVQVSHPRCNLSKKDKLPSEMSSIAMEV